MIGSGIAVLRPTDLLWSFGASNGPIAWSQLNCAGTESSIHDCSYSLDISGCTHTLDVGISCVMHTGECMHVH